MLKPDDMPVPYKNFRPLDRLHKYSFWFYPQISFVQICDYALPELPRCNGVQAVFQHVVRELHENGFQDFVLLLRLQPFRYIPASECQFYIFGV